MRRTNCEKCGWALGPDAYVTGTLYLCDNPSCEYARESVKQEWDDLQDTDPHWPRLYGKEIL